MNDKQTVIIIGAGIGGLFCGAILSKEGYRVKVFEQHTKIGGGLHQFIRNGVEFETGMHVIGAFHPSGVLYRICSYLGIMGQLDIMPLDDDCYELLHLGDDKKKYAIPKGGKQFVEKLGKQFPEEKENIKRYLDAVYHICSKVKLYNLKYPDDNHLRQFEEFNISVGDFINSFTENERLRTIMAFNNPLYAGDRVRTPAYIHALISKFYLEGASRFVGGSAQLADALTNVITEAGGEVLAGNGVAHIEIEDQKVQFIKTVKGEEHTGDFYISSIHPSSLFKLLDRDKIQKSYWKRIDSIPNSYSAFSLYIIFKPESFRFFNYTYYYLENEEATWQHENYTEETWPRGMMFITPPIKDQGEFAEKMIVNCIMKFETVKQWENTFTGKRGTDYEDFKKRYENKIIDKLEKIYPDIRSCIKKVYSSSPLTIRDYYNQVDGALYGVKKDCTQMALSHIPVRTKLSNLLLTGQNINLHGILGVPLTAINTCAELVGINYLIDRINEAE